METLKTLLQAVAMATLVTFAVIAFTVVSDAAQQRSPVIASDQPAPLFEHQSGR